MSEEQTVQTDPGEPDARDGAADPFAAERNRLVVESKKYRQRAQKAESRLAELERRAVSDEDRELFEQLKAQRAAAGEDQAHAAERYNELLAARQAQFDADLAAATAGRDSALAAFEKVAVTAPIQAELARRGVTDVTAAVHLIQNLHPRRARAKLADGRAVVQVVDDQDNPVIDVNGQPDQTIGIDRLVAEFLATDTGKHFLPASGDSGSGAYKGSPSGPTLAELLADPEAKAAFIAKHGGEAFMKLAGRRRKRKS